MSVPSLEYSTAIKATNKSVQWFLGLTAVACFLYGSRTSIWIAYAQTFDDFSIHVASWILYIDSILIGIAGVFFSSMGDYIGFDKSITLKILMIAIGCGIEAFASNFNSLCIGFIISQTATQYVTFGYISWILPTKHAKKQTTLFYGLCAFSILMGPMISGIIFKLFKNYRIIFIINFIMLSILCGLLRVYVYGTQKQLEKQQITTCLGIQQKQTVNDTNSSDIHSDPTDILFPSFLHSQKDLSNDSNDSNVNVSITQWLMIVLILIEMGLYTLSAIMATYAIPFFIKYYSFQDEHTLVLIGSLQIASGSCMYIITAAIMNKYNDFITKTSQYMNPNFIISVCSIFIILITMVFYSEFIIPRNEMPLSLYFLFFVLQGPFLAIPHILLEYLLLDVLPKQHSGKINGAKCLMSAVIRGFYLLFIGLLWDTSPHALFIPTAAGLILAVILSIALFGLQRLFVIQKQLQTNIANMVTRT